MKTITHNLRFATVGAAVALAFPGHAEAEFLDCAISVALGDHGCMLKVVGDLLDPVLAQKLGLSSKDTKIEQIDEKLKGLDGDVHQLLDITSAHYQDYVSNYDDDLRDKLTKIERHALVPVQALRTVYGNFDDVTDFKNLEVRSGDPSTVVEKYFDANGHTALVGYLEALTLYDVNRDNSVPQYFERRLVAYFDKLKEKPSFVKKAVSADKKVNPLRLDTENKPLDDVSNLAAHKKEFMTAIDMMMLKVANTIDKLYRVHAFSIWYYFNNGWGNKKIALPVFIKIKKAPAAPNAVAAYREEEYKSAMTQLNQLYYGDISQHLRDVRSRVLGRFPLDAANIGGEWRKSCNTLSDPELAGMPLADVKKKLYYNGVFLKTVCKTDGGEKAVYLNEKLCPATSGKIDVGLIKNGDGSNVRMSCVKPVALNNVATQRLHWDWPYFHFPKNVTFPNADEFEVIQGGTEKYGTRVLRHRETLNILIESRSVSKKWGKTGDRIVGMNGSYGCLKDDIYCKDENVGEKTFSEIHYNDGKYFRIDWNGRDPNKLEPVIKLK